MLAGELEREPRVDRAEHGAAVAGALAQAGDVLQQPGDLRGREIGVEHEPGARADERFVPVGAQPLAQRRRAAVLPDERAMQGLARGGVPHADRLALVGDRDRGQLARADVPGIRERLAGHGLGDRPQFGEIVLDPAGLGEVLRELAIRAPDRLELLVVDEAGRAGGALVDGEDHERERA